MALDSLQYLPGTVIIKDEKEVSRSNNGSNGSGRSHNGHNGNGHLPHHATADWSGLNSLPATNSVAEAI